MNFDIHPEIASRRRRPARSSQHVAAALHLFQRRHRPRPFRLQDIFFITEHVRWNQRAHKGILKTKLVCLLSYLRLLVSSPVVRILRQLLRTRFRSESSENSLCCLVESNNDTEAMMGSNYTFRSGLFFLLCSAFRH